MIKILYSNFTYKPYITRILLVLFAFTFCFINAQVGITIDEKLDKSKQQFLNLEYVASIESANKALELSKKASYSKGITLSNIAIAKALAETGIYQNSLQYLENAEKEPFFAEYINAQIETYRLRGRIYGNLKMDQLAIREFYKQLKFSHLLKDPIIKKRSMFWAHQNMAQTFSNTKQYDSVWSHLMTQKKIIESLPNESLSDAYYDLSTTYISIGEEYIRKGNHVAARENLDHAMAILKNNNSNYLYQIFNKYGNLEDAIGNTKNATDYYKLALNNAVQLNNKGAEEFANKVLADYFMKNKLDVQETNRYLKRYQVLADSLNNVNKNVNELVLNQILNQKNKEFKKQTKIYLIGISALILLFVGVYWVLWKSYHRKKAKLLAIKEQLNKKKMLHEDFVKQNDQSKSKELIELGKMNNPQFIVLFTEVHPDFIAKLKALDPTIKSSELSFCAMIYLNFSTKEIAEYTFVTIRAVQIRKNRLRKKYDINSDEDLLNWMRNL